jgi:hypothetical protein
MDWFSFNYKPKDFKKGDRDKTLPEILEMKPSKVGLDFFTKYEKEIAEAALRPETISAIHFLSDLRNKADIFDKCYKSGQHGHMKRSSPRPMQAQQQTQAQQPPAPQQQPPAPQQPQMPEPVLDEGDERPLIENQEGGRSRRRRKHKGGNHHSKKHRSKHSSSKHSSGDHTECTHSGGKRSSRTKRSSSKRSSSKRSRTKHSGGKRRTKHRRIYKGGKVEGPNDILNKSNPSPALPVYKPLINTSK